MEVPSLDPAVPPICILPGKVENLAGRAVFDAQLKMLDELVEKYRVSMRLTCEGQEVGQSVEVSSRLIRLAPPLRDALQEGQEAVHP